MVASSADERKTFQCGNRYRRSGEHYLYESVAVIGCSSFPNLNAEEIDVLRQSARVQ